jgi:hypothetical protein
MALIVYGRGKVLRKCAESVVLWIHDYKTSELYCDVCVHHLNQEHMVKVTPEALEKCARFTAPLHVKFGKPRNQEHICETAPDAR